MLAFLGFSSFFPSSFPSEAELIELKYIYSLNVAGAFITNDNQFLTAAAAAVYTHSLFAAAAAAASMPRMYAVLRAYVYVVEVAHNIYILPQSLEGETERSYYEKKERQASSEVCLSFRPSVQLKLSASWSMLFAVEWRSFHLLIS